MDLIYGQRCPGCAVVCANLDSEHLNDCPYRGEIRLLTRSEADHLRECAEQDASDDRRKRFGCDDEFITEGPTGLAAFYSGRYV